jgi:YD repeat-containing protein
MWIAVRRLVSFVLCCVVGFLAWSAVGVADGVSGVSGQGGASSSGWVGGAGSLLVGDPFVVPSVQMLDQGQQTDAAEEALRESPQAIVAREASQTAYEHLDAGQARKLAAEVFPEVIGEPAGGPPALAAGSKITGYLADNVAQVVTADDKHEVIESVEPIALETAPGEHAPIDLHLQNRNGEFEPAFAAVKLQIPDALAGGIGLGRTGVSVTPVDAAGAPLTGTEGKVNGTTVMYANTLADGDTLVKPATFGFSVEDLLRSVDSPRELYFRVSMPTGAKLVEGADEAGVDVVDEGATIAAVLPPVAHDAEGTPVPVTMSVSGDVVSVTVAPFAGVYELPIDVDPTFEDPTWENTESGGTLYRTNWIFEHEGANFTAPEHPEHGKWTESISEKHSASEWGGLFYTTRGESQITLAFAEGHWNDKLAKLQNYMVLYVPKAPYLEDYSALPEYTEENQSTFGYTCLPARGCPGSAAGEAPAENNNTAGYEQESTGTGATKNVTNTLTKAYVSILQEKGPTVEFNKTSPTLYNERTKENVANVLYGSGEWLSPHHGGFEVRATDPGVGLREYLVDGPEWAFQRIFHAEGDCAGVQCPPEYGKNEPFLYNSKMSNGNDGLDAFATDEAASMYAEVYDQTIKVDGTPPGKIKVSGFQNGNELPLGESHVKVEATDGEGTTPSSGVKSITVTVDGHEVPGSSAHCSTGLPCTASTEMTLSAADYSSGQHSLVVTATDNAENVAQEEFTFRVHGATPISVGPGSVDPSTGELTLNDTDVSLGGTAGVSRTYESRHLTAGAGGPLGPQWAINLGAGEKLTVLTNGTAVLTASGGASTTFALNAKGEFESPTGDSDLKLAPKEKNPGKGITEYVLSDATTGTQTTFEQTSSLPPSVASGFGAEAAQLKHPISDAVDTAGDVWVTSNASDLVEKFSPTGTLLGTYGSYGTAAGQYIDPWGIAVDPRNNNVYVTDQANNRIEEISATGAFIKAFGWGVSDGKDEFEICTKECRAGITGTGNGQFGDLAGVEVDSSGNVWAADFGNNRIQEFNEKGEYLQQFGKTGKEAGQFEGPTNIAFSGGNLYVTDFRNSRVQEFSTSGTPIRQFGTAGSENGEFSSPYGIASDPRNGNLYVVDSGNKRVQEFTSAGTFITKFGTAGLGAGEFTEPTGVGVNSTGSIYVVDYGSNEVEPWMRSTWLPTEAGGALAASTTTYAYTTVEEEGQLVSVPSEVLSPVPSGLSAEACKAKLERGCRALTFNYASETTAKSETEWGDYKGHLTRVYMHAWKPEKGSEKGEMTETEVAHYLYDKQGRLRAEWDPRISPELKTTYGYDEEGHVTAVSPPGQQPWLFTYGTTEGDSNLGRLLSVTRPAATTALGAGEAAPQASTEPSLSTSKPIVGEAVTINKGVWSASTLSYGYQWYTCTEPPGGGTETCSPIQGAVNPSYTPLARDRGKRLEAVVTASNTGGTTQECAPVNSAKCAWADLPEIGGTSELSQEPTPTPPSLGTSSIWTVEYHVPASGSAAPYALGTKEAEAWGQKDDPVEGAALFPPDEPMGWPAANYKRATISYWDAQGRMVNKAMPSGGIATSEYNSYNEVVRTLSADNRAAALKETGKTAEVSKLLDTESRYSGETTAEQEAEAREVSEKLRGSVEPGTELVETLGPQHKVKLAEGGSEVLARSHVKYFYDEGSPEGKHYGLVTRTTDGAEYEGKEADVRTTASSYAGQHALGWTLRKATSTMTDPAGLDLTHTTEYNESGAVIETKAPEGTAEVVYPPVFNKDFGSAGSGNDEFNHPEGLVGYAGKVIAVDQNNDRFEEFKTSGAFISAYGSAGTGDLEFSAPFGIVDDPVTGDLYISDSGNNRIEVVTVGGAFVEAIGWGVRDGKEELETCTTGCKAGLPGAGNGEFDDPTGLTFNSAGDLWVTDTKNNRVEEISPEGTYVSQFGTKGSGNGQLSEPTGIAMDEGQLYVVDYGNDRVEEFSAAGAYLSQFGSKGSGERQFSYPVSIVANATSGDLYISDTGNSRIQEWTPAGKFLTEIGSYGAEAGELSYPTGVALEGKLYVADQDNNRISMWNAQPEGGARMNYSNQFGSAGSGNGQFSYPIGDAIDGHGNVWVSDYDNNRIEEFSTAGKFLNAYGTHGSGHVQFSGPSGIAVNQSTGDVYVGDCGNHRIEELNEKGEYVTAFGTAGSEPGELGCPEGVKVDSSGHVWVVDSEHDRIEEYSSSGTFIATYGKAGSEEGEFNAPTDLAFSGGDVYVADTGNHRVEELSATTGEFLGEFGKEGGGDGEFYEPTEIAADPAGNLYVVDSSNGRVQEFNAAGTFLARFASEGSGEGQLSGPLGIAINAAGSMYVVDSGNNRVEQWMPVNQTVHDTQTIYYTAKEEAAVTECRNHPEWAGLACQTQPAAQPETGPSLPVSLYTYNIWDEVEKTTETFGTTKRTKAETYDAAGRALTSETTSTTDEPLPKVTNEYNEQTGTLVKQSTEAKGKAESITSKYNTLGELVEYTDATGNIAKYTYDVDGRITEHSEGKGAEAKSSQAYTYNTTTGDLEKLVDSGVGTFTAEYDVEGNMLVEKYPNAMNANYTYNAAGQATSLEYVKQTHCTEKCMWLSDHIAPSIHGETLLQSGSLATERYSYDKAGRLSEVQEEPTGKPCVSRLYAYDEESDRTSLTTREGTEGKCATEGGTVERHTYDQANRLTDTGTSYETFGNTTQLPAADAGKAELVNTYDVDNQLATEKQGSETLSYSYDPEGRTLETVSEGTTSGKITSHYSGAGGAVSWTSESSGTWTRNVLGINGSLSATQTSSGTKTLQLQDLQGNIIATASTSETETKLLSTYNSTEFGVPQAGTTPPKYAWLGASGLSTETALSSDAANLSGASYVPLTGRPLETQTIAAPGAFPEGTGFNGVVQASYLPAAMNSIKQLAVEHEAELQEAARKEAEEHAAQPCGSECAVSEGNLPTQGGAEETESVVLGTGFEGGSGGASAAKYFNHEVDVSPWVAGELGTTIFLTHHLGPLAAGFLHVPGWLIEAVNAAADAKLVGGLDQLAANLNLAAAFAAGPVTIHAYGQLHGYFYIDVDFETTIGVDQPVG